MNAHITFSHEKVKFCVYLCPNICALPHNVFIRIFPIHLNTYSRGDVCTMHGNVIRITSMHNEIYSVTHKYTFIDQILNRLHVLIHFATNRFTFEKFSPPPPLLHLALPLTSLPERGVFRKVIFEH